MAEEAEQQDVFANIDRGLHAYYVSQGRSDYLNDDGTGKFLAHCQAQEFEADEIDDELEDKDDCMYFDFDDEFPFNDEYKYADEDKQQQFIFDLLKQCHAQKNEAVSVGIYAIKNQQDDQVEIDATEDVVDHDQSLPEHQRPETNDDDTKESDGFEMDTVGPGVQQICNGLKRYYKARNSEYKSMFAQYCIDSMFFFSFYILLRRQI